MKKIWNQTGRSMVEILGVLAIMGVLSVLGVYSYRYAMLRLKANEVIDFVSMFYTRALASDAGECVELTTNDDIGMPTSDLLDGLSITLTSCPHEGCGGHIKLEGESLETEEGKKICSQLVKAFGNEPTPGSPLIVDCAGLGYDSNCPAGRATGSDSDECTACQDGYLYLSYDSEHPCQEVPEDFGCTSNDDCEEGEVYCALKGYDGNGHPAQGSCEPIGFFYDSSPDAEITQLLGVPVRFSSFSMTWWSADNWCRAQGKQLLPVEDFQCYRSGTSTPYTENMEQYGYCCAGNGATCSYVSNWHTSSSKDNYSPVLYAVGEAFGFTNVSVWTASNYGTNNYAYYAILGEGGMSRRRRDGDTYSIHALCK